MPAGGMGRSSRLWRDPPTAPGRHADRASAAVVPFSAVAGDANAWSVSVADGVASDPDALISVLASHHERVLDAWRAFTTDEWSRPSRNAQWSVHDTARHVADAMEQGASLVEGANGSDRLEDFDPRSTPLEWLEASDRESPADTCARYETAAGRFRDVVRSRLASGDDARSTTVYGDAHWTMNIVHILWDSWIHERDVLLPLGREQMCSAEEERLVGLYGVFMAGVPSKLFARDLTAIVDLRGHDLVTLDLRCDGRQLTCEEAPGGHSEASGDHGPAIDALSGRGLSVADALPGAPGELALLAAYLNS
jgi:hypothetical protein